MLKICRRFAAHLFYAVFFVSMAAVQAPVSLTLLTMDASLKYLLDESRVPLFLQEKLAEEDIVTLSQFVNLDSSKDALRTMLAEEWNYVPASHPGTRSGVAAFLSAWDDACIRRATESQEAATARASRLPRTLPVSDHLLLRKSFQASYVKKPLKFPNEVCPSNHYIEHRLNMIEEGEQRAEALSKVTTRADGEETPSTDVSLAVGGSIRVFRTPKDGCMPRDTEELRAKLKVWGTSWIFASLKLSSRPALAGITPEIVADYADFLCGPRVLNLSCKGPNGETVTKPTFDQVLGYDYAIRSAVADLMNDGSTFVDALHEAMNDKEVRDRGFFQQVVLGGLASAIAQFRSAASSSQRSRSPPPPRAPRAPRDYQRNDKNHENYYNFGKGKGKEDKKGKGKWGKGKGKGKGKDGGASHVKGRSSDGRLICFGYNDRSGCKKDKCNMIHICSTCESTEHAAFDPKCPGFVAGRWVQMQ